MNSTTTTEILYYIECHTKALVGVLVPIVDVFIDGVQVQESPIVILKNLNEPRG